MSLVQWNPFREVDNFTKDMWNMLDRFPFSRPFNLNGGPKIDIYETNDEIIMKAEIPGIDKKDLNVSVDENYIRLSGQIKRSNEFSDENIYHSERFYGNFSRTIPLPVGIKPDQTTAEYKDGILTITAPKQETSKKKEKRIDIN